MSRGAEADGRMSRALRRRVGRDQEERLLLGAEDLSGASGDRPRDLAVPFARLFGAGAAGHRVGRQAVEHGRYLGLPQVADGGRLCLRRRVRRRRRRVQRQDRQCLLPDAAARTSRLGRPRQGILRVQQCGRRRPLCPTEASRGQGDDRRLGRASWKRHAGYLLRRRLGLLFQHASIAVVPVDGQSERDGARQRAGHDAELPSGARRRPQGIPGRVSRQAGAGREPVQARAHDLVGRIRRPARRSLGPTGTSRQGLPRSDGLAPGNGQTERRGPRDLDSRGRL